MATGMYKLVSLQEFSLYAQSTRRSTIPISGMGMTRSNAGVWAEIKFWIPFAWGVKKKVSYISEHIAAPDQRMEKE